MRLSQTVKTLGILALVSALHMHARAAQGTIVPAHRIAGVVLDSAGAPVRGAEITLITGMLVNRRMVTGDDGRFSFNDVHATAGTITAAAQGFAQHSQVWRMSEGGTAEVKLVLAPAPVTELITVTATRTETKLGETAASVVVLTSGTLSATAA